MEKVLPTRARFPLAVSSQSSSSSLSTCSQSPSASLDCPSTKSPAAMYCRQVETSLSHHPSFQPCTSQLSARTRNSPPRMEIRNLVNGDPVPRVKCELKEEECAGVLASLSGRSSPSPLSQQAFEGVKVEDRYVEYSQTRLPPVSILLSIVGVPGRISDTSRYAIESSEHQYAWGLPSPPPFEKDLSTSSPQAISSRLSAHDYMATARPLDQPRTLPSCPKLPHVHQNWHAPVPPSRQHVSHRAITYAGVQKKTRRPPSKEKPHNNKPYIPEQVDYIRYYAVDLGRSWEEIVATYDKYWAPKVDHPYRGRQGLQGVYYRQNKSIYAFSPEGLLVLDHKGDPELWSLGVRGIKQFEKDKAKKNRLKLSFLYPKRAIQYPWVSEEHKQVARQNLAKYEAQIRAHKEMLASGQCPPRHLPDAGYTRPSENGTDHDSGIEDCGLEQLQFRSHL